MTNQLRRGFTLVELMVVITIMAILAAILLANMSNSAKIGRDTQRQSNVRLLQNAIEAYKHKNGRYPIGGCSVAAGTWVNERDCATYIVGLAPEFISVLPHDTARGSNEGYSYVTNGPGTVYKVMAMNTVELDTLTYTHPFKSCDVIPQSNGTFYYSNNTTINIGGWCSYLRDQFGNTMDTQMAECRLQYNGDGGTGRFDKSYGVWGGFEAVTGSGAITEQNVRNTTAITCL